MSKHVKPIPEGYHTLTPYLIVDGAERAIDFYKKALGAAELFRLDAPGGKIGHAELQIGNSRFMLADEHPGISARGPRSVGGSPVYLLLYVEDVDAAAERALAAGMQLKQPVQNQFYGDRRGTFEDPFGYTWTIASRVEDVPPEEMARRAAALGA